jgi:predicted RNA binding protein YcfA (HicA-like mRNA interferase family)
LLKQDGWFVVRQTGSHHIMKHDVKTNLVSVPFHGSKELSTGMLRKILKDAKIETRKR